MLSEATATVFKDLRAPFVQWTMVGHLIIWLWIRHGRVGRILVSLVEVTDVIRALASCPAWDRLGAQRRSHTSSEGGGQSHGTCRRRLAQTRVTDCRVERQRGTDAASPGERPTRGATVLRAGPGPSPGRHRGLRHVVVARGSPGGARASAGPLPPEADPGHRRRAAEERPRGCRTARAAPAGGPAPDSLDPPDDRAGGARAHPAPREPGPGADGSDEPAARPAGPAEPPADLESELVDRARTAGAKGPAPPAA